MPCASRRAGVSVIALAFLVTAAHAEDGYLDLRLGIRDESSRDTLDISNQAATASEKIKFDSVTRSEIGGDLCWRGRSLIGGMMGAAFAYTEGSSTDAELKDSRYGLTLQPGLSIGVKRWFDVELSGLVGIGHVSGKIPGDSIFPDIDYSGKYIEYGGLLRPVFSMRPGVQGFAEIGFIAHRINADADGVKLVFSGSSVTAGAGIGYRF